MRIGKISEVSVGLHGRTYFDNENLGLSWSASGFDVKIDGTTASMECCVKKEPAEIDKPFIGVSIDGKPINFRFDVSNTEWKRIVIADGLNAGIHTLKIMKLTESSCYPVFIKGLETDGSFLPIESEHRPLIEIIGDSITCGFGVESNHPTGDLVTSEENVTKSYGYLTAQELNADLTIVAHSGWAVYKSCVGECLPEVYDQVDTVAGRDEKYDFNEHPDVIVCSLGTNDNGWINQAEDGNASDFTVAYIEFINHLHDINPEAVFICTIGMLPVENTDAIRETVNKVRADGINISLCELPATEIRCSGHPSEECHRIAAEILVKEIKSVSQRFAQK